MGISTIVTTIQVRREKSAASSTRGSAHMDSDVNMITAVPIVINGGMAHTVAGNLTT